MDILHEIRTLCADTAFREEIVDLLERLCAIDTTPGPDLARLRANEQRVSTSSAPLWRICASPMLRSSERKYPRPFRITRRFRSPTTQRIQ